MKMGDEEMERGVGMRSLYLATAVGTWGIEEAGKVGKRRCVRRLTRLKPFSPSLLPHQERRGGVALLPMGVWEGEEEEEGVLFVFASAAVALPDWAGWVVALLSAHCLIV